MEKDQPNRKEYYKLPSKTYLEEKEIKTLINTQIDQSLNATHARATFGKVKNNSNYNDYDEEY